MKNSANVWPMIAQDRSGRTQGTTHICDRLLTYHARLIGEYSAGAGPEGDRRAELGAIAFERIGQCVLAALDKQPIEFSSFLPQFLRL